MKKLNLILIASTLIACKQIHLTKETTQVEITKNDIVNTIVNDKESFIILISVITRIMT